MYILVALRTTHAQVFLMNGRHRELTFAAIAECVANLALSIALALWTPLGIIGVAIGTLLPNLALAIGYSIPSTLAFTGESARMWMVRACRGITPATLVAAPFYAAGRLLLPVDPGLPLIIAAAAPGFAAWLFVYIRFGLTEAETAKLIALVPARARIPFQEKTMKKIIVFVILPLGLALAAQTMLAPQSPVGEARALQVDLEALEASLTRGEWGDRSRPSASQDLLVAGVRM